MEKSEASPHWVPGCTSSCKSSKRAFMSMEETFLGDLTEHGMFLKPGCPSQDATVPPGHPGNHLGRYFILQMKSLRSRIVKQASPKQSIAELGLVPKPLNLLYFLLYTYYIFTPIIFLAFGFTTTPPNLIRTRVLKSRCCHSHIIEGVRCPTVRVKLGI